MRKPSARIAVAALAIPLFGGFATYAAAQVSTQPSPQVVIPAALTANTKTDSTVKTTSSTRPGHDANDDHGRDGTKTSSTVPGHDANDDHGHDGANTSSTVPGHDANDDHGHDGANTSSTVPGHDANDDHGNDARTSTSVPKSTVPTSVTTPNTVDDHGGDNGNRGKGGGGHDD
jgi:hypothetical protein